MLAHPWLKTVRRECRRLHLPPLYVERLMGELSDHLTDVMEDSMSTDASEFQVSRLGSPNEIAAAATHEYRRGRFSGRHPWLAFVVMPVVTLPLLWAASILAFIFGAKALGFDSEALTASAEMSRRMELTLPFVVMAMLLAPIAAAAIGFCRLAVNAALSWKWILTACAILAVVGGMATANVALPTANSMGTASFGFGVNWHPSAQQLLQFALPLSIGCWVIYRQLSRCRIDGQLANM